MKVYLQLTRYKNILIIFLFYLVIAIKFKGNFLGDSVFILVFAHLLSIAAGYVINDIFDAKIDLINKPNNVLVGRKISLKNAYKFYFTLLTASQFLAFLSFNYWLLALISVNNIILFIYSWRLKSFYIFGNFTIALLAGLSVWLAAIIFIDFATDKQLFYLVLFFISIAFCITFVREIVKDIEDVEGDRVGGCKTLPIVIGINHTKKITFLLITISIAVSIFTLLQVEKMTMIIYLSLLIALLVVTSWKLYLAKQKQDYTHISKALKLIIIYGLLFLFII